ncbi:phage tailspike protein [Tatumella morbirosei]|uniref:phage tailspike protein n=1 Tax=Tatumella morbirosei TaxID=642227 RepID=UPI00050E8A4E|nr:phage tailspike protein [Tatumella morbirosei]
MADNSYNIMVSNPVTPFTMSRSFKACSNGKIFIGQPDTDPTFPQNQIPVFVENECGKMVQVPQPIVINTAGYPVYHGQIAKFVTTQNYSMAVYDSYMVQQFYWDDLSTIDPQTAYTILTGKLASPTGRGLIGYATSFAALREIIPEQAGQLITLLGYNSGSTLGGGEFISVENVTDDGVVYAATSGTYGWKRRVTSIIDPYMAGCVGDGVTDDTVNFNAAIQAAAQYSTVSGQNLQYARGQFRGYSNDPAAKGLNKFKITSQITIPHKRVCTDMLGTMIDFTAYPVTGTSIDSPSYLLFFKNDEGSNYGISHHFLPYALGIYGSSTATYIQTIGFDSADYNATGNRIVLEGGNFNGGYTGIGLSKHTYFLHMKDTTFNHQYVNYYVPAGLTDAGEEVTFERVKFTQSNLLHYIRGGTTWFKNCSLDYPYSAVANDYGWVKCTNGEAYYEDCWFEGYGPYGYVFNFPSGSVGRVYVRASRFVMGAGSTQAQVMPYYMGSDTCLLDIDDCSFWRMSDINTSYITEAQRGLVAGTGTGFRLRNTRPSGTTAYFPSTIYPLSGYNDTMIDRTWYSGTATAMTAAPSPMWAWCYDATGTNTQLTRNTYGTSGGTVATLSKVSGYLQFAVSAISANTSSFYRAVVAAIPIKNNGNIAFKFNCNTSVACTLGVAWAAMADIQGNRDSTVTPQISKTQNSISYPLTTTGSQVQAPSLLQGGMATSGASAERAPDWATHALIYVQLPNNGSGSSIKIYDVYAREI